jgi:hypothetical protein
MRRGAQGGSAPRRSRRQKLLEDAGMAWAERSRQQEFWTRRNKSRRPAGVSIGVVAKSFLEGRAFKDALRLGPLRAWWEETVPAELRRHSDLTGVRGGRLTVMVDDPAVKFVFEREIGRRLLSALRATRCGAAIREISYQLGSVGAVEPGGRGGMESDE